MLRMSRRLLLAFGRRCVPSSSSDHSTRSGWWSCSSMIAWFHLSRCLCKWFLDGNSCIHVPHSILLAGGASSIGCPVGTGASFTVCALSVLPCMSDVVAFGSSGRNSAGLLLPLLFSGLPNLSRFSPGNVGAGGIGVAGICISGGLRFCAGGAGSASSAWSLRSPACSFQ